MPSSGSMRAAVQLYKAFYTPQAELALASALQAASYGISGGTRPPPMNRRRAVYSPQGLRPLVLAP